MKKIVVLRRNSSVFKLTICYEAERISKKLVALGQNDRLKSDRTVRLTTCGNFKVLDCILIYDKRKVYNVPKC